MAPKLPTRRQYGSHDTVSMTLRKSANYCAFRHNNDMFPHFNTHKLFVMENIIIMPCNRYLFERLQSFISMLDLMDKCTERIFI